MKNNAERKAKKAQNHTVHSCYQASKTGVGTWHKAIEVTRSLKGHITSHCAPITFLLPCFSSFSFCHLYTTGVTAAASDLSRQELTFHPLQLPFQSWSNPIASLTFKQSYKRAWNVYNHPFSRWTNNLACLPISTMVTIHLVLGKICAYDNQKKTPQKNLFIVVGRFQTKASIAISKMAFHPSYL